MKVAFDPDKNELNIRKHGFSLDVFERLDFEHAIYRNDARRAYGEQRIQVLAPLHGRLCTAVFTPRGDVFRVISVRKSSRKERKWYEGARR